MSAPALAKIPARQTPARWQADLALAIVALIWGTTFVVVKGALGQISTFYFLSVRFSVASLCLLLLFARAFQRTGLRAFGKGLRAGALAGLFLCAGYILQTLGLRFTSAGNSGFLTGFYIVLVPLISACVYRRWPQRRELFGVALATLGIVLLTLPSLGQNFQINKGDLLTIGCAVAFAFHLLVLGYFSKREQFEAVALGQIACTAVLCTMALGIEPPKAIWNLAVVGAILLTAILATALAFSLQTWGQRYTTPTRTALIFALEPVFALVTSVVAGGEKLTVHSVSGGTLILVGILTVELKPLPAG